MKTLADRECVPCKTGAPPLHGNELDALKRELGQGWRIMNDHQLEKEFEFEDFRQALTFTNQIGELSEDAGHHPDIYLAWGKVKVTLWTHSAGGLTESDFILAARIQKLCEDKPVKRTALE
jgi:4a-hydroxytetrahydrobiopterin dehydratase